MASYNLAVVGSGNIYSPIRPQAITWSNDIFHHLHKGLCRD